MMSGAAGVVVTAVVVAVSLFTGGTVAVGFSAFLEQPVMATVASSTSKVVFKPRTIGIFGMAFCFGWGLSQAIGHPWIAPHLVRQHICRDACAPQGCGTSVSIFIPIQDFNGLSAAGDNSDGGGLAVAPGDAFIWKTGKIIEIARRRCDRFPVRFPLQNAHRLERADFVTVRRKRAKAANRTIPDIAAEINAALIKQ